MSALEWQSKAIPKQAIWFAVAIIFVLIGYFLVWPIVQRSEDVGDVVTSASVNGIEVNSGEVKTWFDALTKCMSEREAKHTIVDYLNMRDANFLVVKSLVLMTCPQIELQRIKRPG